MPDELVLIADSADAVIDGYAFTLQDGCIRVLNLASPNSACVIDSNGRMLETTMDNIEQALVGSLYRRNAEFLGI